MENQNSATNKDRVCNQCGHIWLRTWSKGMPEECPKCGSYQWHQPKHEPLDQAIYAELERSISGLFGVML